MLLKDKPRILKKRELNLAGISLSAITGFYCRYSVTCKVMQENVYFLSSLSVIPA